jgi:hypothetical protein
MTDETIAAKFIIIIIILLVYSLRPERRSYSRLLLGYQ